MKKMRSRRMLLGLTALMLCSGAVAVRAAEATKWVEGRHYARLSPAQPSQAAPGKVEVTEVFSYGCPACFQFQTTMQKLKAALPANAQLSYVHAAWNTAESWPLFQRAFLTAQALGIAERNHTALFTAIWGAKGELAILDPQTQRIKPRQPTIEDVARFYAKQGGVTEAQFLQTAKSFSIDARMKQSDALVKGYETPGTPTLVVAGKYRIDNALLSSPDQYVDLVRFLIQKESGAH